MKRIIITAEFTVAPEFAQGRSRVGAEILRTTLPTNAKEDENHGPGISCFALDPDAKLGGYRFTATYWLSSGEPEPPLDKAIVGALSDWMDSIDVQFR